LLPDFSGLCFSPSGRGHGTLVEFQVSEPVATVIRE
jgi:hypothetical protein